MTPAPDDDNFRQFTILKEADLKHIARATRGEYRLDDVIHEVYPPRRAA